jgi:hypothetical protein
MFRPVAVLAFGLLLAGCGGNGAPSPRATLTTTATTTAKPLFTADFSGRDGLITNEWAHWNAGGIRSAQWDVTSGSLFRRGGLAWSGAPDASVPDRTSANGSGSSVFRMTTRDHAFENVTVSLRVRALAMTDHGRSKPSDFDGVHLFARWQNERDLYAVSLIRRDGQIVVKRKTPGGTANGGTYQDLYNVPSQPALGAWQTFDVTVENTPLGVRFGVRHDGREVLNFTDPASPPAAAGAIGIRGDNTEFEISDLTVRSV